MNNITTICCRHNGTYNTLEDQIWQTIQSLNHAWTVEGNTEKLREYFHKDMVAITATDRERLEGREACIASWKAFVEATKIHHWHAVAPKIQLYGNGKTAVVTYYYDMSFDLDGQTKRLGGRDMFVLVNENGHWWVVANQFSDNPQN